MASQTRLHGRVGEALVHVVNLQGCGGKRGWRYWCRRRVFRDGWGFGTVGLEANCTVFTANGKKISRWLEKKDTYRRKKNNPLRN